MDALNLEEPFDARKRRITRVLNQLNAREQRKRDERMHLKRLHYRIPNTKEPYPAWPRGVLQPPHVKVPKSIPHAQHRRRTSRVQRLPPLKLQAAPAGNGTATAVAVAPTGAGSAKSGRSSVAGSSDSAKEDINEAEDHVKRCAFGVHCRGDAILAKNAPACWRCYTCAKYTAGGTGLYCDACFRARHPWHRVDHVYMPLGETRDPDDEWASHAKNVLGEQLTREYSHLLHATQDSRRKVCDMASESRKGFTRISAASAKINTIKDELLNVTNWIKYGGSNPEMRKELAAALRLQGAWRVRKAQRLMRVKLRNSYTSFVDKKTGRTFFVNVVTGEGSWKKPRLLGNELFNLKEERRRQRLRRWQQRQMRGEYLTDEEAARMIQQRWAKRKSANLFRDMYCSLYRVGYAPDGRKFYFNVKTHWASWKLPECVSDDDVLSPRAYAKRERDRERERALARIAARGRTLSATEAATKIQCWARSRQARLLVADLMLGSYQRVLDEKTGQYYYNNTKTGSVTWIQPGKEFLDAQDFLTPREFAEEAKKVELRKFMRAKHEDQPLLTEEAAIMLQSAWRRKAGQLELRERARTWVVRVKQPGMEQHYYYNKLTGETAWHKPLCMGEDDDCDDWDEAIDGKFDLDEAMRIKHSRRVLRTHHLTLEEAAHLVQTAWRTKLAWRGVLNAVWSMWERCRDDETDRDYYYNLVSGEVRWSKPLRLFLRGADIPTAKEREEAQERIRLQKRERDARYAALLLKEQRRSADTAREARHASRQAALSAGDVASVRYDAATRWQAAWRGHICRLETQAWATQVYEKALDPSTGVYYYYNTLTRESVWTKPWTLGSLEVAATSEGQMAIVKKKAFILERQYAAQRRRDAWRRERRQRLDSRRLRQSDHAGELTAEEALMRAQCAWRAALARRRVRAALLLLYERQWDPATRAWYYYNKHKKSSVWVKPFMLDVLEMEIRPTTEAQILWKRTTASKLRRYA